MAWVDVADATDLDGRGVIGREVEGRRVAVYRLDGALYATQDLCTHGQACLSQGEVVEGYIECPLHFGLFEIATGKASGAPVTRDLATYPVRVEGGRIWIELDA